MVGLALKSFSPCRTGLGRIPVKQVEGLEALQSDSDGDERVTSGEWRAADGVVCTHGLDVYVITLLVAHQVLDL